MNTRPTFVLRFRTKKQYADMKRLAKAEKFTLNEYIIRKLESGTLLIGRTERGVDVIGQFAQTSVEN